VQIDDATRTAKVVVPDNQLSLAIGKEGLNARLAAKLTGWRVDIRGDGSSVVEGGTPETYSAASERDAGGDGKETGPTA
jgi:N utilization substance protein A